MERIHAAAVRRIKEEIPLEILSMVFMSRQTVFNFNTVNISMDAQIEYVVIESSVMMDVAMFSGREVEIDLAGLPTILNLDDTMTISVPLERTQGREIMEIQHVSFNAAGRIGSDSMGAGSVSPVDQAVNNVLDATNPIPVTSSSRCSMIAPNVILAELGGIIPAYLSALVTLANDREMTHINSRSYDKFGEMVVEKCKAYIYNKTRISMDRGIIERGSEMGTFKEVIDGYADANLNYRDLLKRWRKTERFNDRGFMEKYIKGIIPII